MSWTVQAEEAECPECDALMVRGDRVWKEPKHLGLTGWGVKREVIELSKVYCEECGKILEYERT